MTSIATPIAAPRTAAHWLVQTAGRARLAGADQMSIPAGVSIADAWDIDPPRLVARVRAALRRSGLTEGSGKGEIQ